MAHDLGARIAERAFSHVGTPFRLHGRSCESGFDCVGLVADALGSVGFAQPVPIDYSLRGRFENQVCQYFEYPNFQRMESDDRPFAGDICLVRVAPRQLHLIIIGSAGFIHAHAGLRRVVMTPGILPWPILGHWRFIGK